MKRNWRVERHTKEVLDGHQRWDRAYQSLLEWSTALRQLTTIQSANLSATLEVKEPPHASSHISPCVDEQPSPSAND